MPLSFDGNIFFNLKLVIKYVLNAFNKYASAYTISGTRCLNGKFGVYHRWYTWHGICYMLRSVVVIFTRQIKDDKNSKVDI